MEAAVRLVLAPEGRQRSVIWVAQTDELCEQAVQAFRQVWLNVGAARTALRIVRLWGGNPNPAPQDPAKPVAIVASIQTLNSRFSAQELAWLRRPGLVVVDECHHAITPSYTNLLRWLDAEAPRPGTPAREEPPIIGLSATPFRTDDDESSRLARRFDGRWLPHDQEALYQRLRAQGVLAEPVYEGLQSGTALLPDEADRLARLPVPGRVSTSRTCLRPSTSDLPVTERNETPGALPAGLRPSGPSCSSPTRSRMRMRWRPGSMSPACRRGRQRRKPERCEA